MRKRQLDPYTNEKPDILELLARMDVGGSYRSPFDTCAVKSSTSYADVPGAAGMMRSVLARETAIVVATRAGEDAIARLAVRATPEIENLIRGMSPTPLDMRLEANVFRLKIISFDAARALVWPEKNTTPLSVRARKAKMRKADYVRSYHVAYAFFAEALENAREEMTYALTGKSAL